MSAVAAICVVVTVACYQRNAWERAVQSERETIERLSRLADCKSQYAGHYEWWMYITGFTWGDRNRALRLLHADISYEGRDPTRRARVLENVLRLSDSTQVALTVRGATNDDLRTLSSSRNIVSLVLPNGEFDNSALGCLQRQPHLREISLFNCSTVGDSALVHFQHLSELESVDLRGCYISDSGLLGMQPSLKMKALALDGVVTGEGLCHLVLPNIESLVIDSGAVTDQGCACISRLSRLKHLMLDGAITDAAVRDLACLTDLESLILKGSFSDEACCVVGRLKNLKHLTIESTSNKMTSAGVASLLSSPTIESIELSGVLYKEQAIEDARGTLTGPRKVMINHEQIK